MLPLAVLLIVRRPIPMTLYLVLDATERMRPYLSIVQHQLASAAEGIPADARLGMSTYGSVDTSRVRCHTVNEILLPRTYVSNTKTFQAAVLHVRAQGKGSSGLRS
jgi:hypothetical protein